MNYLKQLNLFGKVADIPYDIIGTTDPTSSTEARAGMGYLNKTSRKFFICVDDTPGARVWIPIAGGSSASEGSGESGVGIESITPVSTSTESGGVNVYSINLTDGSSYNIEVKNGSAGKDYVLTEADKAEIAEMVDIPTKTSDLQNDSGFVGNTVSNLTNYYLKSETYTREEVTALIAADKTYTVSVVSELPSTGAEKVIYLVVKEDGSDKDAHNEYLWVNGKFEFIGTTAVDLTGYAKEDWVSGQLTDYLKTTDLQSAIDTALAQAKESGEFDGEPGVSPTVSVSAITGGYRITITDKDGTKTVDVMDGANGDPGDPGRGIASVVRTSGNGSAGTTDTYTITYTDNTTSTFSVYNGADGSPGTSPSVAVSDITGGHRITITDKEGTKTVDVMDGSNGDPGRGITSVKRTSGTGAAGTMDIYTITYSDNTTSTFSVYNGVDGKNYTLTEADKTEIAQQVAGLVDVDGVVKSTEQTFTDDEKAQVRTNIGAASASDVSELSDKIEDEIADLKEQGVQQTPLYAESTDWLNTNGDTSKPYVLPDGYIYANKTITETVKAYENLAKNFATGRLNSSGAVDSSATSATTCLDYIGELASGDIIRIKGFGACADYNAQWLNKNKVNYSVGKLNSSALDTVRTYSYDAATGIVTVKKTTDSDSYSYFRISGVLTGTTDDVIITLNQEIKEETATVQKWTNTGHAFVPADYEERIIDLEEDVLTLQNKVETMGGTSSETVAIPTYWETMVADKTETVKSLQTAGGKECVSFAWASDTHIPDNDNGRTNDIGKVMAKMLDNCEIPFAMLSGDINTRASYGAEAELVDAQASMPVHLAPLWGTDRLLMALGNHDGCYGDSTGYYRKQFTPERMWQIFFRGQTLDFRRVFSDDGLYFYVDNIAQKTRFIVLNSHFGGEYAEDENGWAVNNRFGTSCYGQVQLDWLADIALDMPDGYSAIITAHVPPNVTYTVDKEQFIGIVNAYCNKTTYSGSFTGVDGWTSNNVSVDFTNAKGEIIAMFTGHVHGDSIDTETLSCPLLTILSAGASANEPYKDDAPTRTAGTDTETSFDVVTINRATRTIYCTRVGAGSDREISY